MSITLDPTQDAPSQGFTQIQNGSGLAPSNGSRIAIVTNNAPNAWGRVEPGLANRALTVEADLTLIDSGLAPGDTGVGLLVDTGARSVQVVFAKVSSAAYKLAIKTPGGVGGLSPGIDLQTRTNAIVQLAWDIANNGDVLLSMGAQTDTVKTADLPGGLGALPGPDPYWAFGCFHAVGSGTFGAITERSAGASLTIDVDEMEIKPGATGKIEGSVEVDLPATFDPAGATVTFRVTSGGVTLLDTGALQGFGPHPHHANEWKIDAGGIEAKLKSLGNDRWKVEVEHKQLNVPAGSYGSTTVDLTIDGASGSKNVALTQHGDTWEL